MVEVAPAPASDSPPKVLKSGALWKVHNGCLVCSDLREFWGVLQSDLRLLLWDAAQAEETSFCPPRETLYLGGVTIEWGVLGSDELALHPNAGGVPRDTGGNCDAGGGGVGTGGETLLATALDLSGSWELGKTSQEEPGARSRSWLGESWGGSRSRS